MCKENIDLLNEIETLKQCIKVMDERLYVLESKVSRLNARY